MALESKKEGNIITRLASTVQLPRMVPIRQKLDRSHYEPEELPAIVRDELYRANLQSRIHQGMSVAITCGSRGVANIAMITKAIVDFVKEYGGNPFVFPAMGSHGGATAEGQRQILTAYHVTEEFIGCPIRATMDVVQVGTTPDGMPVYTDRLAHEADAIILCGRVKAHTAFRGHYESGIMKMGVIGMGKQKGAEIIHQDGFSKLGTRLPIIGKVVLDNNPVIGAVGLVENAFDQTCRVRAMLRENIAREESPLLSYSKTRLGKIFFDDIDVLVVDKLGKDISGDGMDPNVTGRYAVPHMKSHKNIQHIAVLDLTDASHGNCNGIGLADVTTKRFVDKIDVDCTYPNVWTSTVLCTPKIPMFTHSDRTCIQLALRTCNFIDHAHPRVVHIEDTMHLEYLFISEAMLQEALKNENVEVMGQAKDWAFNEEGNLYL